MTIDASVLKSAADPLAAAFAFAARGYALWALWTLYAAPALPLWNHTYRLTLLEMLGLLGVVAVWRGVSWPAVGSAVGSVREALTYAAIGFGAAWFVGAAPEMPAVEGFSPAEMMDAAPAQP